ncbi:MAG: hypothetical protein HOC71_09485, partial [Candidatus Latescibacteria bacterium]|nr:hypothetical protein [Candidatus Latescibacterota bacterium]
IPGLKAAARIHELSSELNLVTRNSRLVLNRVEEPIPEDRLKLIEKTGLEVAGRIPTDPLFEKFEFGSASFLDITDESAALRAVRDLTVALDL